MENYKNYLSHKDSSSIWRKAKQLEFNSLDQILLALENYQSLTLRNSMTLRILGLVCKSEDEDPYEVALTEAGRQFLLSPNKQQIIDEQLLKIYLASYVNPRVDIDVFPLAIIYRILSECEYLTFIEYMLFVCWINSENELSEVVSMIRKYRDSDNPTKIAYNTLLEQKAQGLGYADFKDHIHRLFGVFKLSSFINFEIPDGRWSDVFIANSDKQIYDSLVLSSKSFNRANYETDHAKYLGLIKVSPEFNDFTKEIASLTPDEQQLVKRQIKERNKLPDLAKVTPVQIGAEFLEVKPKLGSVNGSRTTKRKVDYDSRNRRNRLVGAFGERVVMKYEYSKLLNAGHKELLPKLEHCSLTDDSLGYDIKSFDSNKDEKHIEVKTVVGRPKSFRFYISANELDKVNNDPNHHIYVVLNYDSFTPEILEIGNLKDCIASGRAILEAVNYTVTVNLEYADNES